jgi:hypothetical protein
MGAATSPRRIHDAHGSDMTVHPARPRVRAAGDVSCAGGSDGLLDRPAARRATAKRHLQPVPDSQWIRRPCGPSIHRTINWRRSLRCSVELRRTAPSPEGVSPRRAPSDVHTAASATHEWKILQRRLEPQRVAYRGRTSRRRSALGKDAPPTHCRLLQCPGLRPLAHGALRPAPDGERTGRENLRPAPACTSSRCPPCPLDPRQTRRSRQIRQRAPHSARACESVSCASAPPLTRSRYPCHARRKQPASAAMELQGLSCRSWPAAGPWKRKIEAYPKPGPRDDLRSPIVFWVPSVCSRRIVQSIRPERRDGPRPGALIRRTGRVPTCPRPPLHFESRP